MVGLSGWLSSESYKNWLSVSIEVFVFTGSGVEDLFRVGLCALVWVGVLISGGLCVTLVGTEGLFDGEWVTLGLVCVVWIWFIRLVMLVCVLCIYLVYYTGNIIFGFGCLSGYGWAFVGYFVL